MTCDVVAWNSMLQDWVTDVSDVAVYVTQTFGIDVALGETFVLNSAFTVTLPPAGMVSVKPLPGKTTTGPPCAGSPVDRKCVNYAAG